MSTLAHDRKRKRGPYKAYEYRDSNAVLPQSTYYASLKPRAIKRRKRTDSSDSRPTPRTSEEATLNVVNEDCNLVTSASACCLEVDLEVECMPEFDLSLPTENPTLIDHLDEGEEVAESDNEYSNHSDSETLEEELSDDNDDTPTVENADHFNSSDDSEDELEGNTLCKGYSLNLSVPDKIKMFLLLLTKKKYNLSYSAAESIMELAGIFLRTDTFFQPSKYLMKSVIDSYSFSLTVHHLCPGCGLHIGILSEELNEKKCGKCSQTFKVYENLKLGYVFLYISIKDQLKILLENGLDPHLLDCANRQKMSKGAYMNKIYMMERCTKILLTRDLYLLIFFIDGLQVAVTSKNLALPILFTLNELPLHIRRSNVMMASVWLGKKKPIMNEYLKPFVKECWDLSNSGLIYRCNGTTKKKTIKALMCISDSVARPTLRNSTQFNGRFGCGLCYHPGIKLQHQKGKTRSYSIARGEYPLRTHNETMNLARTADATGLRQQGIRGVSILSDIPGFDTVRCLDLDLFHALVNTAKRFANLWFHKRYNGLPFSICSKFNDVNDRLLAITPTNNVSRAPRSLAERSDYRGHEWFYWVLLYSIPVLKGFLPSKYLNHWGLLVSSMVMLMQNCVAKSEVVYAGRSLKQSNLEIDYLYGKVHVTFSVHLLTHLERSVEDFGQPWTHSAFVYESFNGEIKNTIKSSNGISHQICKLMQLKIALQTMKHDLFYAMNECERQYLDKMSTSSKKLAASHLSLGSVDLLGSPQIKRLTEECFQALAKAGVSCERVRDYPFYDRCIASDELYHACSYSRVSKQENSIVMLENENVFQIYLLVVVGNSCYALGHFLIEKKRYKLCEGVHLPHFRMFDLNPESSLRCVPLSEFRCKLLSFGVKFSRNEIVIFSCVNVLNMEMLT
ncbi:WD repeat- and FYVE domain-containing protein 4 [Frankliniella fusca]|uniref:WD repeat- and FYVE domain-containing protein 4 n=1 Tax=Frankliniella fusca TaxID=407009 RepID=A0AAE1GY71_9NEOP|nr:WD repeat- and FYVE domain-containing protein 4 [Frankliniella fusca]